MATTFGSLYDYQVKNGIVLPQVSSVKGKVEDAFKQLFGGNFSVDAETPQGRMIEAITLLFADVLRVNALNANSFNINQAVGAYLDNLGGVWGVPRQAGEGDDAYRKRIVESASRGSGYAEAIRNAIGSVVVDTSTGSTIGANNVIVLDNGLEDPQVLPKADDGSVYPHSIAVAPHSVFIAVISDGGVGENGKIAAAIRDTKSAGCGYSANQVGVGEQVEIYIDDNGDETEASDGTFYAQFVRPQHDTIKFSLTVRDTMYTGSDITADTRASVVSFMESHKTMSTFSFADIASSIAADGKGIVCTGATFWTSIDTDGNGDTTEVAKVWSGPYNLQGEQVVITPARFVTVSSEDIEVIVKNT